MLAWDVILASQLLCISRILDLAIAWDRSSTSICWSSSLCLVILWIRCCNMSSSKLPSTVIEQKATSAGFLPCCTLISIQPCTLFIVLKIEFTFKIKNLTSYMVLSSDCPNFDLSNSCILQENWIKQTMNTNGPMIIAIIIFYSLIHITWWSILPFKAGHFLTALNPITEKGLTHQALGLT